MNTAVYSPERQHKQDGNTHVSSSCCLAEARQQCKAAIRRVDSVRGNIDRSSVPHSVPARRANSRDRSRTAWSHQTGFLRAEGIILTPVEGKVEIDVRGDLGGILAIATQTSKAPRHFCHRGFCIALVAGARSNLYLLPEQVKMVAGSGKHTSTSTTLPFISELARQFELVDTPSQGGALFAATA